MRLFIGIPLPESVKEEISRRFPDLPGNRVPEANLHLTLVFLGEVSSASYEKLRTAFDAGVSVKAFEVVLSGLGAFPRPEHARILWTGVQEGLVELNRLYEAVAVAVEKSGFKIEDRKFSPHVTLSRLRKMKDVRSLIEFLPKPNLEVRLSIEHVTLFESHLGQNGARYEELMSFPLI